MVDHRALPNFVGVAVVSLCAAILLFAGSPAANAASPEEQAR